VTGAVFRDTVRFTGELDAGTLTVKKILISGGATLWQSSANALPVCCRALYVM